MGSTRSTWGDVKRREREVGGESEVDIGCREGRKRLLCGGEREKWEAYGE